MSSPATEVDRYLDALPDEVRAALEKLRATIKAAAPGAVETGHKLGKGSIQFQADRPIPAALVKKIVKARIAENQTRSSRGSRST